MSPIIQEPGKVKEMETTAKAATHKVNTHTHTRQDSLRLVRNPCDL